MSFVWSQEAVGLLHRFYAVGTAGDVVYFEGN
jgi:hypothetical protein